MLELFKSIKKVEKDGKTLKFTNFKLCIDVNGNKQCVPIQPVNFGEKSNRSAYSLLNMASKEYIKDENPFYDNEDNE